MPDDCNVAPHRFQEAQVGLVDEFGASIAAVRREHFAELALLDAPHKFLWCGPPRFGVTGITTSGLFYEPAEDGAQAYVVPTLPIDDEEDVGDLGDLVAWRADAPERWWLRLGTVPILNPSSIEEAAHYQRPLKVWSSPMRWLAAGGDGIVVLSTDADLRLWLGGVPSVVAETFELGEEIARRLREPAGQIPQVLLRRAGRDA